MQNEPNLMHGGYILRKNRERVGFTQEQVSLMIGIPLRTYQRWEAKHSEPRFGDVATVCSSVFKVNLIEAMRIANGGVSER